MTMEAFLKHVQDSSQAGAHRLANEWMKECCDIVDSYRDSIESLTPRQSVSSIGHLSYIVSERTWTQLELENFILQGL